jgi:hypothetical protein
LEVEGMPGTGTWQLALAGGQLQAVYSPDVFVDWTGSWAWGGRDSSPSGDPDQDGMTNLAEYALNGNPLAPDAATAPAASLAGDRLAVTFQRRADPLLRYTVRGGFELSDLNEVIWTSAGASNTAGPVTVVDTTAIGVNRKRFLRLWVER